MTRRLYALQDMFLGYFHPDWTMNDASSLEVIKRFRRETNPQLIRAVIGELDELLNAPLSEEDLHNHVVNDYSLFYDPWKDELTMREWLIRVKEALLGNRSA